MYKSAIKAEMLYDEGKINDAIELLEKYVSSHRKNNDELIQVHEYLLRYKKELKLDYIAHIDFLLSCDTDEIFSDTIFNLGYALMKKGETEKASEYFSLFCERVADPEHHAEIFGFLGEWEEIKPMLGTFSEKDETMDIYEKSNYGENIEVLTEAEKECLLCVSFVEEVNSGGLEGYFSTEYSKYCTETAAYLEKNKSVIYPEILRKAIALFPANFDFSDVDATGEYLEEHEDVLEKFEALETQIYESTEDIDSILENLEEQIK